MESLKHFIKNVENSFARVKADMARLEDEFMGLKKTQTILLTRLAALESKKINSVKNRRSALKKKTKKTISKRKTAKKKSGSKKK